MAEPSKRRGQGQIGRAIFAQVERMVAGQDLSRSEAFRRLSEKTGRRFGTVAANYYRVARQRGSGGRLQAKGLRGARRPAGPRGKRATMSRAVTALQQVLKFVEQQEAELEQLHKERARYLAIRRLVARP